ncbi:hypothetical protein NH340_JMT02552 [Sarcoptes scabiei]|nr:hypothetical protein NH340_JMT02552 [Sarcoptes scabiei]
MNSSQNIPLISSPSSSSLSSMENLLKDRNNYEYDAECCCMLIDDEDDQRQQPQQNHQESKTIEENIIISFTVTFLISLFFTALILIHMLASDSFEIYGNSSHRYRIVYDDDDEDNNNNDRIRSLLLKDLIGSDQIIRGEFQAINQFEDDRVYSDDNLLEHYVPESISERISSRFFSNHDLASYLSDEFPLRQLLNLKRLNFTYLNEKRCQSFRTDQINLVIMIPSATDHFLQRQIIRQTWASHRMISMFKIPIQMIHVFVLGIVDESRGQNYSKSIQKQIDREQSRYRDLIQADFSDTYGNLTYKHLLSLRWAVQFCSEGKYILKIDDDAFLDPFALAKSLNKIFQSTSNAYRNLIGCSLFPNNTMPKRKGKWSIDSDIYPYRYYPSYCSGVGYLQTFDVAFDLFNAAHQIDFIPRISIDDVFVTGLVAKSLKNLRPIRLNELYMYDIDLLEKWLDDRNKSLPKHIWIYDIGSVSIQRWQFLMQKLWNKTKDIWTNSCSSKINEKHRKKYL